MKTLFILVALLTLSACSNKGDKGEAGEAGIQGATGPAGKDKTAEYFIFFEIGSHHKKINRPIKVAVEGKNLGLTNKDCVRLKEEQIKTLVISLPEVPAVGPITPQQPAVTVCDNSNKVGGTGADKDDLKTSDDCPLYDSTYIWHDSQQRLLNVSINQFLGDYGFAEVGLTSVQKAKCKTL